MQTLKNIKQNYKFFFFTFSCTFAPFKFSQSTLVVLGLLVVKIHTICPSPCPLKTMRVSRYTVVFWTVRAGQPWKNTKSTAYCPILTFRTNCSTLFWLRCAFFRLRLNFVVELLNKEEICSQNHRSLETDKAAISWVLFSVSNHSFFVFRSRYLCFLKRTNQLFPCALYSVTWIRGEKKNTVAHCAVGLSNELLHVVPTKHFASLSLFGCSLFFPWLIAREGHVSWPLLLDLTGSLPACVCWCLFFWLEPAALTWARGVNSTVSGLLFALCVFSLSLVLQPRCLSSGAC